MGGARELLNDGRRTLVGEYNVTFSVDGFPGVAFTGLCDEVFFENELGAGGFLPGAEGSLLVPAEEFQKVNWRPFPGARLTVYDHPWIVSRIGMNEQRWVLTLVLGHPKTTDLPMTVRVMADQNKRPIATSAGTIQVKP